MPEPITRAWMARHAVADRISTLDFGDAVQTISCVRDRRDGRPIGMTVIKLSRPSGLVEFTYFVSGHQAAITDLDQALASLATIRKAKEPADA